MLQLFGGSLFTDHSGGLIHSSWVHFVRDLEALGGYAWGPAVLARLYRELCNGCKASIKEVAGCLLLLQLWAWERLPTLAPVRTTVPLEDVAFWGHQLPGPHGARYIVAVFLLVCTFQVVNCLFKLTNVFFCIPMMSIGGLLDIHSLRVMEAL